MLLGKGLAMGAADAIPGVSGGTIAFICGIYEELIASIKSIDIEALQLLRKLQIKNFWQHINGNFLVTLVGGIAVSMMSLARIIPHVLLNYPVQIWSFFFGLIIISSVLVIREMRVWSIISALSLLAGIGIAYYVTIATPAQTPDELWFIFLCGVVAICAMILPGVSGAFILLIMGKYEYVYSALKNFEFDIIVTFILGCLVGILSFARAISWYLKNYHNAAIGLLSGFMIGSLNKIWPWKTVVEYRMNSSGEQVPFLEENVMPQNYLEFTGNPPLVVQAFIFAALGIFVVFILEKVSTRVQANSSVS